MRAAQVTTSKRLITNTLWNMITMLTNVMVRFLMIPFFLGHLGRARYGVWVLIGSLFYYRSVLSMGLNSAINRYIPRYIAQDDEQAAQRTLSTALCFYVVMAMVCLAVTFLLYRYVGVWFGIEPGLIASAKRLVLIVGIGFSLVMPLQLAPAVLSGLQRYDIVNRSVLGMLLTRTALLLIMLLQGFGLITMGLVYGISEILMRVIQWIFAGRLLGRVSLTFGKPDMHMLGKMLALGANTFLYTIGAVLMIKSTDLLIGAMQMGMEAVTYFSLAAAAVLFLSQIIQNLTRAIMPAVSDLQARGDQQHIREMAFLAQKYSLLLMIPAVSFFVVMGESFLKVWLCDSIKDPIIIQTMATILAILVIGHGVRLAQHSNFLILVGCGRHQIFGRLMAWTALLVVLLSILFVTVFQTGLIGLAWAHLIPLVVISGVVLPLYFSLKMGIPIQQNVTHVWIPALLGSIPALVILLIWHYVSPPSNWIQILGVVLVVGVTTLTGAWCFSLNALERLRFKNQFFHTTA